jgi:hypothetical protein
VTASLAGRKEVEPMMEGMMNGRGGWLGLLIALLVVVLLGLGIAALIKDLRS